LAFGLGLGLDFARYFLAGESRQLFHRLGKAQSLVIHDKTQGVAAGAAAKAVIELLVGTDGKRGGLFFVEGAAGAIVLAGAFEFYAGVHQLDDIDAVEQVVDKALGDKSGHRLSASLARRSGRVVSIDHGPSAGQRCLALFPANAKTAFTRDRPVNKAVCRASAKGLTGRQSMQVRSGPGPGAKTQYRRENFLDSR